MLSAQRRGHPNVWTTRPYRHLCAPVTRTYCQLGVGGNPPVRCYADASRKSR
jgi:hypothetical protein